MVEFTSSIISTWSEPAAGLLARGTLFARGVIETFMVRNTVNSRLKTSPGDIYHTNPWGEKSISSPSPLFSIVSKEKQTIIPSVQPIVLL